MHEYATDRARKVMQLANQEAQRFNHEHIGTEHILLGLVKESFSITANVLKNLGLNLDRVRLEVEKIVERCPDMVTMGKLPHSPQARKVIEYFIEQAPGRRHSVGTEHLLLGLLREKEGVAARVLTNLGVQLADVREEVVPDLPYDASQALKNLHKQIESLNEDRGTSEHDPEEAAHLRDRADKLKNDKAAILAGWRSRFVVEPAWLTWNQGTVANMARTIHDERRWQDLPVLADALDEAGCANAEILTHCREAGEHATRCWVLDLLRGGVTGQVGSR
jgi:ATP-dependent Clp protease ATP-binding subunit ClpA